MQDEASIDTTSQSVNEQKATTQPEKPSAQTVKKPGHGKALLLIAVGLLLAGLAGYGGSWLQGKYSSGGLAIPALSPSEDGNSVVNKDGNDVASVAEKVSPSVVSIMAGRGAGTGIIISADGYILTNDHVVKSARDFTVVTAEGVSYKKVRFVGYDPLNDIAFLKIEGAKDLPVAEIGDSGTIRVGQPVITIGNALGQYSNSVTSGIVSGLGRPLIAADALGQNAERLSDLIQTDAAINSGNSGGPLVNMAGQVIGVNVAMAQGANTVGFAIPINAAKGIIAGVLEKGSVSRAYIGVHYVDITPEVIAEHNLSVSKGALVGASGNSVAVPSGGPADKAGVKKGDIITRVNDQVVGENGELVSLIGQYRPGDSVKLTILRDKKEITLTITLGDYDDYSSN